MREMFKHRCRMYLLSQSPRPLEGKQEVSLGRSPYLSPVEALWTGCGRRWNHLRNGRISEGPGRAI